MCIFVPTLGVQGEGLVRGAAGQRSASDPLCVSASARGVVQHGDGSCARARQ
jgi:hypothetical protein